MNHKYIKSTFAHYLLILVGTVLIAASVNWVFEPLEMVTGGVTGLAIVVKKVTSFWIEDGVPIWLTNIILNVPLFIAAIIVRGKSFLKNTLFATVSLTIALYLVPPMQVVFEDNILAALFGGVLGGVGMGLVFVVMASTGGTDLLAMIIHKYKPYYSVPQILIVIDSLIVIAGIISFGLMKTLYAIIAVYITAKVSDGILEGLKFAKMAYIISDDYNEIAQDILIKLSRGVTGLSATGMYSNSEKKMLFCVVSKKEIVELTEIVTSIDPKAFIIICDAREVTGEGFREYRQ
ncbi:MAG: YitT family protein [Anaerocolumna sp.]